MSDEMISLDLGGNNTELVQAAVAGAGSLDRLTESAKKAKQAFQSHNQTQDQTKQKTDGVKGSVGGLKGEMGGLSSIMGQAKTAAVGLIAGYAGLQGIRMAWSYIKDEIRAVIESQQKLADQSRTMEDATKAVYNQTGMSWEASGQLVQDITRAGRFSELAQTQSTINQSYSAWSDPDDPSNTDWQDMGATVAEFSGRKGLGAQETGLLIEVLKQFGAISVADIERLLPQIYSASLQSMSEFSPFVHGLATAAPQMVASGATNETVLASLIRGRELSDTAPKAGEMSKQMDISMRRPEVMGYLANQSGMSVEDWLNTSYQTRQTQLGEWISTGQQTMLQDYFSGDELARLQAFYTPAGFASMQQTTERLGGVGRPDYLADRSGYNPAQARREELRSEAEISGTSASGELMTGTAWAELGASAYTTIMAGGDVEGIRPIVANSENSTLGRFFAFDEEQKAVFTTELMQSEARRMLGEGERAGIATVDDIGRGEFNDPELQAMYVQFQRETAARKMDWSPLSANAPRNYVERAELLMDMQERIAESTERTADNSGEANTGMHD